MADLATTREQQDTGVHIMIAGLALQVASLLVFAGLCLDFAWTVRKNKGIGLSIEGKTFGMFLYGEFIDFFAIPLILRMFCVK